MRFWRVTILSILFLACWLGLLARLAYIQVLKHNYYFSIAEGQSQLFKELTPKRGEIFIKDKDGHLSPLATSRDLATVYLSPKDMAGLSEEAKLSAAEQLASLLGLAKEDILAKINKKGDPYEPLKNKVESETVDKIKNLHLIGVNSINQSWRWYPQNNTASQLLGFVGYNDNKLVGRYGLEEFYEKELAGTAGVMKGEKDAFGRTISIDMDNFTPAVDGSSLVLTIDPNIQFTVQERLKAVLEKWQSPGGTVIVEDPKTGAIKAMASFPSFNPNEYFKEKGAEVFANPATQQRYEPGSIFKPVTMSAGIDSGKVTPQTTFVDTGLVQIGGRTIKNAADRSYGLSTMTRVLEKSINTGAVFVGRTIGHEVFKKYVQAFGFDHITGVDLSKEAVGSIANLSGSSDINYATATFGQGISVTPIQMAAAIGAIANGGKMMKPYVVEKIIYPDNTEKVIVPEVARQPITEQTAKKLTDMLVSTVERGYDKIKIKEYIIAGKTGTAEIPGLGGYTGETIHSFVGYAPAYNPAFLIFIKMDKPKGINFASDSLAPVFADIAKFLFNYYEIPPERKPLKSEPIKPAIPAQVIPSAQPVQLPAGQNN